MTPEEERAEERAAFQLLRTQRDELERENAKLREAIAAIGLMADNRSRVNMPNGVSLAAFCGSVLVK